jgi:aminopeptidase N
MKKQLAALGLVLLFIAACNAPKGTVKDKPTTSREVPAPSVNDVVKADNIKVEVDTTKEDMADAKEAIPDTLPVYRATPTLTNDILHTKIDVRFDYKKQHVLGKVWITAKPYFYPQTSMTLDAKGFEFQKITMEGSNTPLKYTYKDQQVTIDLGKTYTRNDKFTLYIEYIAKPNEGEVGGSDAITSDKGLFFINPDEAEPDKPRQIWSQGETESNSHWFPTFDKPNEKMTSEVYITVEDKFKTLSNGLLKDSKKNSDGSRTDHWLMDMPHAPYLVMIAAGDFAVVTEKWKGKDIMYYVEPKYEKYAKTIYKNVPEILTFFSERLGVEYPWQKLAHITVRDYVSGAMENTTAIVYGEFMNGTDRELIDKDYNEIVVAHEMFHHWFGDLVTAESWSNLTVNESFADFSEGLWLEHKYGMDEGDHHRREAMEGYFGQAEQNIHNLVEFKYTNREAVFDAHSYNKGGGILHMLRTYLGDDAFFTSLQKYLTDNKFKTGEAHQLRLAFEEVSGQDLNWFFNQWYYAAGHPQLDISYAYDEAAKQVTMTVEQKQEVKDGTPAIFDLPVNVDIYQAAGQVKHEKIRVNRRKQTFTFDAPNKPALVDFDADRALLAQTEDNHTEEEFIFMYDNAPRYLARAQAIENLRQSSTKAAQATLRKAMSDKNWAIRQDAIQAYKIKEDPSVLDKIAEIAVKDTRSTTRSAALAKLAATKDAKWAATYRSVLDKEPAYPVISAALQALYKVDADGALVAAKKYENDDNSDLVNGVGSIYSESPKAEHIEFFERSITKIDGLPSIGFLGNYVKVLSKLNVSDADVLTKMGKLKEIATNQTQSPWRRFACAKAISDVRKTFKGKAGSGYADMLAMLTDIVSKEKNEQLKTIFSQMLTP